MKKCSGCNKIYSDNDAFCPACGKKTEYFTENSAQELTLTKNKTTYCPTCGVPVDDEKTQFCGSCGNSLAVDSIPLAQPEGEKRKKKLKNKRAVKRFIMCAILVLVVSLGVTVAVKLNTPVLKLGRSLVNMAKSGDSYEFSGTITDNETQEADIDGSFMLNPKNKQLGYEYKMNYDGYLDDVGGQGFFDIDNEFIFNDQWNDNTGYRRTQINDMTRIITSGNTTYYMDKNFDLSVELAGYLFEAMQLNAFSSEEDINEAVMNILECYDEIFELNGAKSNLADQYEELSSFSQKLSKKVGLDFVKKLTSEKWLEEYIGYKYKKGTHTFDVKLSTLMKGIYEILENRQEDIITILEDAAEESDIGIRSHKVDDLVEEFFEEFDSNIDYAKEENLRIYLAYKVSGGYVNYIEFDFIEDGYSHFAGEFIIKKSTVYKGLHRVGI